MPAIEAGYQFDILHRVFLTPFVGIASQFFSVVDADRIGGKDLSTPMTAAAIAGLTTDIVLKFQTGAKSRMALVSRNENAFWILRIRAGYSNARFETTYSSMFTGGVVFVEAGLGGFGRALKRKL
jgi:hypothetical protein